MYYILLENGVETVDTTLNEMLYDNNVNTKDSAIKKLIEEWYYNNLREYDEYLEETIYCNDRSIRNIAGWKDDGGNPDSYLLFKEYNSISDLSCSNETDKFSISNNKAKLKYKVGLTSKSEMNLINNSIARKTGASYWLGSPYSFYINDARVRYVNTDRDLAGDNVSYSYGARPSVSLKPGTVPVSGDGSMNSPYVVDTTVNP